MVSTDTILDNLHIDLTRPEEVQIRSIPMYLLNLIHGEEVPIQLITTHTVLLIGNIMFEYRCQYYLLTLIVERIVLAKLISPCTISPIHQGVLILEEGVVIWDIERAYSRQGFRSYADCVVEGVRIRNIMHA